MAYISPGNVKVHVSKSGGVCLLLKQMDLYPKYVAKPDDEIYVGVDVDLLKRVFKTMTGRDADGV